MSWKMLPRKKIPSKPVSPLNDLTKSIPSWIKKHAFYCALYGLLYRPMRRHLRWTNVVWTRTRISWPWRWRKAGTCFRRSLNQILKTFFHWCSSIMKILSVLYSTKIRMNIKSENHWRRNDWICSIMPIKHRLIIYFQKPYCIFSGVWYKSNTVTTGMPPGISENPIYYSRKIKRNFLILRTTIFISGRRKQWSVPYPKAIGGFRIYLD